MKAIKIYFSVALLLFAVVRASAQPRISIFFDHVSEIARQEKITVKDAAERVRQLGVDGIDVRVSMGEAQMKMLDSLGFQHASAIADIDFVKGEQPEQKRQALDFMRRYGYSRLLVIPGLLPENASPAVMDDVCKRLQAFVEEAAKEGIDVMVEDYDNPRSPCYNTQTLDRLFAASRGRRRVGRSRQRLERRLSRPEGKGYGLRHAHHGDARSRQAARTLLHPRRRDRHGSHRPRLQGC